MRSLVLGITAALGLVVGPLGAGATPVPSGLASVAAPAPNIVLAAHHCGKGRRWVPAGYAEHGKYRAGHCAPASSSS